MDSSHDQQQEQLPIGTTVMDTQVLKEPRGFIRCLEWIFALVAFATCANFSTTCGYKLTCNVNQGADVVHNIYYPFKLDGVPATINFHDSGATKSDCFDVKKAQIQPGDFHSDAQFFVFTGVIAWLGATACLVIYVFFSQRYLDDNKRAPMIDFCFTVIVAVCWLSASAAWANGVIGLKSAAEESWLTTSKFSPCETNDGAFVNTNISACDTNLTGSYGGANASILLGFLNFFLWASNLWFIYKETQWFANRSQSSNPPQQMES